MTGPRAVAFVHLDLGDGGAQRLSLLMARHLDPARYAARIVCLRGDGRLVASARDAGVPVAALGRLRRPRDAAAAPALARHLRRARVDVVHVPRYSRVVPYAALAAHLAGAPLLVVHDHVLYGPLGAARRLADAVLLRRARYVAVSEAVRRDLVAGGAPPGRIALVRAGIDVAGFAAGDRARGRRALGVPGVAPLVLVPARLHPMKGHVDLLAAWPRVLAAHPDAVLVCAGDGPLRQALPALAAAAGLAASVRFVGARDDLPDLLAAADVVALPSRVEGLPLALLEAAAAGRPTVATAVGGVPEAVEDGRTGRLVPPRDPRALAAALVASLGNPEARGRMGEAAAARASRDFGIERMAATMQDAWDGWLREAADGR